MIKKEMEKDYKIAKHRIRIESDDLIAAVERIAGFEPFEVKVEDMPLVIFATTTEKTPVMDKILYTSHTESTDNTFGRYMNGFIFTSISSEGECLQMWQSEDKSRINFKGSMSPYLVRFSMWIAFGLATLPYDTIAIHTSVINYRNQCVLFLGESGTGKSTHTRLWRENIMGAVLLNDDSPILRIIDDKPWVFGSPWSGKTPCYKNEQYPLASCVRLSQAPGNEIKRLNLLQAYGALHPSCPPDFAYDERLYDYISDTLSKVLNEVPVYHLACLPNAEAAYLSCETIFGK